MSRYLTSNPLSTSPSPLVSTSLLSTLATFASLGPIPNSFTNFSIFASSPCASPSTCKIFFSLYFRTRNSNREWVISRKVDRFGKKKRDIWRMLTQSSEVFRTHPTMCRAVAVDCVKRLYDGLGIYNRWECWGGGHVRYRKYTPWTLPRRRKDIFCVMG